MIIEKNFDIAFINKRKHNTRICEGNFETETKKEIGINDLIKINLYFKKSKMSIKKCYNDFFFTSFHDIKFSRIRCLCLLADIVLFDLRKSTIIEFFYIFFLWLTSLYFLLTKSKRLNIIFTIIYLNTDSRIVSIKFVCFKNDLSILKQSFIITIKNA